MNKFLVDCGDSRTYATKEEAIDYAKRRTAKHQTPYIVYTAIAIVESPAPEAVVTEIT